MLNHFEVDNTSHQWERRLVFFIKRLNLVKRSEWVLLFSLVELLVQRKLIRAAKNAVWEAERLCTILSIRDRTQVLAETGHVLLGIRKVSDT